jgi:tetratricopeptide (TPR) repeat protein
MELGRSVEQTGDYEQAIANYEQALEESPDQPKLRKRLAEMKDVWKIKSAEHSKARQFVYDTWANQDISHLDDLIPRAREAIDTLITVNDYLTAGKFKLLTLRFVDDLAELASQLQDADEAAERDEVDRAKRTIEGLSELAKRLDKTRPPEANEPDPKDGTEATKGDNAANPK